MSVTVLTRQDPRLLLSLSTRPGALRTVLLHPLGGGLGGFVGLVPFLGRLGPVYGIRAAGLEAGEEPDSDVPTMIRRYADLLCRLPERPNLLVGWSFGGLLAWELAAGCTGEDGTPAAVILLDSSPEPWTLPPEAENELRDSILDGAVRQPGVSLERLRRTVDAHILARREYRVTRRRAGRTLVVVCCDVATPGPVEAWSALAEEVVARSIDCAHLELFSRANLPVLLGHIADFLARP